MKVFPEGMMVSYTWCVFHQSVYEGKKEKKKKRMYIHILKKKKNNQGRINRRGEVKCLKIEGKKKKKKKEKEYSCYG